MSPLQLPLRDVHEPVAPPWWPLAPGWWIVAGALLLVALVLAWLHWRRARRRRLVARLFDDTLAAAPTRPGQVVAMSELLRRAAARRVPEAATRDGDAWLLLLDEGLPEPVFSAGAGAILRDGGFRQDVDAAEVEALRVIARARFIDWMQVRR
ncbi:MULTISPECIES: DUF4381 domain-containing protein [unclassified Luteimonas]